MLRLFRPRPFEIRRYQKGYRCILMAIAAMMFLVMSCGGDSGPSREDFAAKAAKEYYDSLIGGGYGYFTDGFNGTDSLPATISRLV